MMFLKVSRDLKPTIDIQNHSVQEGVEIGTTHLSSWYMITTLGLLLLAASLCV